MDQSPYPGRDPSLTKVNSCDVWVNALEIAAEQLEASLDPSWAAKAGTAI